MPDTSKLEKLNRELEKSEKKLRKAINDEKALQHQLKQLTRKERTHRLCTRGGMLESFLQEPERLTDDDVMLLLKLIFHRQDTQEPVSYTHLDVYKRQQIYIARKNQKQQGCT